MKLKSAAALVLAPVAGLLVGAAVLCFFVADSSFSTGVHPSYGRRLRMAVSRPHPDAFHDPVSVERKKPNKKPHFILHIGPGKIATSTIQKELTNLADDLSLDNYDFLGDFITNSQKYPRVILKIKDLKCHRELENVRLSRAGSSSLTPVGDDLSKVPCWNDFLQELEPYRQRQRSVILSHEGLSYMMTRFRSIGLASLDWISLKETLEKDWNILVVIGYRRYFSWLFSSKLQSDSPILPANMPWPSAGGRLVEPLFPNYWQYPQHSRQQPWSFTDSVVSSVQPHVPFVLMNFHDDSMSIRSNFLCKVLPDATNACSRSLDRDKKETELVANPARPPRYYDMLVTAAAEKGLIDTKRQSRLGAEELARKFQETILDLTIWDFPVQCPKDNEMEVFLDKSLRLEAGILPEFAASPQGETRHRAEFWSALRKFCSIDTEAVLENENWKRFFASGMDIAKVTV